MGQASGSGRRARPVARRPFSSRCFLQTCDRKLEDAGRRFQGSRTEWSQELESPQLPPCRRTARSQGQRQARSQSPALELVWVIKTRATTYMGQNSGSWVCDLG